MKKIKLFFITLLMPLICFAQSKPIEKTISSFSNGWNHPVFNFDNQEVTVANIIIGLIIFAIGLKIAKYLGKSLKAKLFSLVKFDKNSANLLSRVIDYILIGAVIIIALDIAGVPLTIFTFIGGAFVVSIGLSSQHLVNNFISGLVLIIEGKIKVGDLIEADGQLGRVDKIESRAIELKTQDNLQITIPHVKLMQDRFTHWSRYEGKLRISTHFKINHKAKHRKNFNKIILNAVAKTKGVLETPAPQVLLSEFKDNHLCYEVRFWLDLTYSERKAVKSEVNENILSALEKNDIELAIPYLKSVVD